MFGIMMVLMLGLSGEAGNEVLDFVDSKDYWQAKQVKVSVEAMLGELKPAEPVVDVDGVKTGRKQASVRRLMAIRTLGELKDARATATLTGLLKSAKPFEADYARRALAAISGRPLEAVKPDPKAMRQDVGLLPNGCGMVLHARFAAGRPISMDEIVKKFPAEVNDDEKASMRKEVTAMLVSFVEQTGNLRLDAVTVGLASDVGPESGWMVVVARGQYDRDAVLSALKNTAGDDLSIMKMDGQEVIRSDDGEVNLILEGGKRLVMVAGPPADEDEGGGLKQQLQAVIGSLRTGKANVIKDREMAKLVAGMDPANEVNLVMRLNDTYRETPFLKPFDTLTATVRTGTRDTEWKLVAKGQDAEAIKKTVAEFKEALAEALADMKQAPPPYLTMVGPYLKMMESLKVEQDGTTVTLKTRSEGQTSGSVLFLLTVPYFSVGHAAGAAPDLAEPAVVE